MSGKISKYELKEILKMYLSDAKSKHEIEYSIRNFLFYISKNTETFDKGAIAFVDKIADILVKNLKEFADTMTDGENKRTMLRQIAMAKGEHFSFRHIVNQLFKKPDEKMEINKSTEDVFIKLGQIILDFLYDIPKNGLKKEEYVVITLFQSAIDELLVSFHLAQHGFSSQSFHHSRTVLEIIDMAELFRREPDQVVLWSDENTKQQEKWKEFSPGKVREKLKKDKHDPTYSFMSEIGTHITSYYIKPKVSEEIEIGEKLKKNVKIKIGGSSQEWSCISANTACIHATMMLINQLAGNFQAHLLEDEVINMLVEITEDYKKYVLNGFVKFSRENEKDTAEMEEFIKKIKITP